MWISLAVLVGGYTALMILVAMGQRGLIYYPTAQTTVVAHEIAQAHGFQPWQNPSGQLIGWKRRTGKTPVRGQVLILHGNAGSAIDRVAYGDSLQAVGAFDVFILEYPGYGPRAGKPTQPSLLAAASEALALLTNSGRVYLVGESLGAGVAAYLAGNFVVHGLMLFCPFHDLTSVAQHHMPIFPVRWLLRDTFPAGEWLRGYPGPLGVLLAGRDRVVPPRFGRKLYQSYAGPKKLWEIAEADHNDVWPPPPTWWGAVFEFWNENQVGASH